MLLSSVVEAVVVLILVAVVVPVVIESSIRFLFLGGTYPVTIGAGGGPATWGAVLRHFGLTIHLDHFVGSGGGSGRKLNGGFTASVGGSGGGGAAPGTGGGEKVILRIT